MNIYEQMIELFEIIEPQSTKTFMYVEDETFGLKKFIEDFLQGKKGTLTVEGLVKFQKFVEEKDLPSVIIPFREAIRGTIERTVSAYCGKAIFFSDHHHIYQPDRYDVKFADYIHEKICKECYDSMSKVYQYYSVNIGPTLLEWFRQKRPDIMEKLIRGNRREPIMAQTYTHQILPLIRNEEDLRAEIIAGIQYRDLIFGPLPKDSYRGIWIPECTIGIREAKCLAEEGVDFIILRGDQSAYFINTVKPYKIKWEKEDGKKLELMVFYYHHFSKELSFDKWTTDNPHNTINHMLKNIPHNSIILLAHDGELVHHRWEYCHVDVSGFFKELPVEIYRRKHPSVIMMTPSRYIRFLKMKAMLEDKEFSLPVTELPDFPTSWSCGGYEIKSFTTLKGIDIEHLMNSSDKNIIRYYSEMLVIRKLQGGTVDPVDESQWEYLVMDQMEKFKENFPLSRKRKEEIRKDLHRGVNVCFDIRKFNKIKAGGAGRWAFGSLDSGNSDYQTYLREAVMIIEDKVMELFKEKVRPCFKDIVKAKADFMVFRLDELAIPDENEEKFNYLQKIYPSITEETSYLYQSKKDFFEKHLIMPLYETDKDEIWSIFCIWNRMRRAYTSCAYFFDDFNNHVAEDAVLRATEAVFLLEEYFNIKVSHDFLEKLKECKSRYRRERNQGPDLSAARVAKIHLNILKLEKSITSIEKISKDSFMEYIKSGKYSLPHPASEAQEYYRAFVNEELSGFTSREGIEELIAKTSREVARTKEAVKIVIEKRDLSRGDIVSRFRIDVNYDQIEPEKPYLISPVDNDLLISTEIEEKYHEQVSSFYVNNIALCLSDYCVEMKRVRSVFIDPEKIILEYSSNSGKNRRDGADKPLWEIQFAEGQKIWELAEWTFNLRSIRKKIKKIKEEIEKIEEIDVYAMEKFYNNLTTLYREAGNTELLYGEDGKSGLKGFIEEKSLTVDEGLNLYLNGNPGIFPESHMKILQSLLIYEIFLKHDNSIGHYELQQKYDKERTLSLYESVTEYCKEKNIPYEHEIYIHKLWKYQRDRLKYYRELLEQEERTKGFLSVNMTVKKLGEEPSYTLITYPVVYVHGAANEENFEGFYPDNEAIPAFAMRHINRNTRVIFLPGSVEIEGQLEYFRKMQRYLLEKFSLQNVKAGIFACGSQKEVDTFIEREETGKEFFLIPSLEGDMSQKYFSQERLKDIGSKHLEFRREEELELFEEYMNKSDIIYLGGGWSVVSGLRYFDLMFNSGKKFRDALREFIFRGGLLMGVSAGAMVMGMENIVCTPKARTLEGKIEGLGLFPANIQVHYEEYGIPEHLDYVRRDCPSIPVVAIDTQTAVLGKLNFKLNLSENPFSSSGWHMEGLNNIELLSEKFTVLGSKSVTVKDDEEIILFDGMECPKEISWKKIIGEG
jgi:peptidase E